MSDNKEIIAVKALNNYSIEEILRSQNNISPASDIYENNDEYILVANMPGVPRSEVQVKVITFLMKMKLVTISGSSIYLIQ
ncbi:MAG: hypothetical protein H6Q27_1316 [Ignavibacteriaceae bacterium]|nr:hypothetical protein [Ignavibacteriaceae bacterium]